MTRDTISVTAKTAPVTGSVTSIAQPAARLSIAGTIIFLVLLFILHFIKPELEPSWHFISEYAIGKNGWLMVLAFLSLSVSYVSLFIAIRSQIPRTIWGRFGLALVLISAAGLAIAGIFTTDPIMTTKENMTISGALHNLGGTLGIAMPFATLIITWQLVKNPAWQSAKRPLIWAAILALAGFAISLILLGVMLSRSDGKFGPGVLAGWPNRLEILGYTVWQLAVAGQAIWLKNTKK